MEKLNRNDTATAAAASTSAGSTGFGVQPRDSQGPSDSGKPGGLNSQLPVSGHASRSYNAPVECLDLSLTPRRSAVGSNCLMNANSRQRSQAASRQPQDAAISSATSTGISYEPQTFGNAVSNFRLTFKCQDISVTSTGQLLVAAEEHGLKELTMAGTELSHWKPAHKKPDGSGEDDWVTFVDCFQGERVAAAVHFSFYVAVLRRNPAVASWSEERRVVGLYSPVWQLSVHGELMAAAQSRSTLDREGNELWIPGPRYWLTSMTDSSDSLKRWERDFDVRSLALTKVSVVIAGRDNILRCYDHNGQDLWSLKINKVADICSTTSGKVLYVALRRMNKVISLCAENERDISDALTCAEHGILQPKRLSIRMRASGTVIAAVLSDDRKTMTVRGQLR